MTAAIRLERAARENRADVIPFPERQTHSWTPIDLVTLGAAPPQPPSLSGIAYPGRRHVWSGEPESLETWLALCVAVEELRGHSARPARLAR